MPGLPAANSTAQLGEPGPWFERLPHFRPEFTPSAGDELQTEYLLPAEHAVDAVHALQRPATGWPRCCGSARSARSRATSCGSAPPTARTAWPSTSPGSPTPPRCCPWSTLIEQQLAPFGPRPHWGKVFTTPAADLHASYDRLPDFLDLAGRLDPAGKFRNAYTARCLGR